MHTLEALNTLHEAVKSCSKCDLSATRSSAVPGSGYQAASFMFVGEAPGREEDKNGLPFVGKAGQLLDELLSKNTLPIYRSYIYITNLVKCRPPENRDPETSEITACNPYLEDEIRLVDPYVIVTLGRYALNYFIPDVKISKIHGSPQIDTSRRKVILPMYHPAAALRSPDVKVYMQEDFKQLHTSLEIAMLHNWE